MTCSADPFALLHEEFLRLQHHLAPLRARVVGGLTSLRTRLNRLTVAALAADDSGAYIAVNEGAAQLTGFHVHTLQRMSVWDLTPPPDERTGDRLWAAFLEMREQHGLYTLQARSGPVHAAYVARAHVLPHVHVSLLVRVEGR